MKPTKYWLPALALFALLLPLAGCGSFLATVGAGPVIIEPVGKKNVAAIQPNLRSIYYRIDRDDNLDIVMQDPHTTKKPAHPGDQEYIILRVFWQPRGGVTSLSAESINTTFRYIVINSSGAGLYEGAGFVRLYGKVGKPKLTARILDGDLRLTESTSGFVDTLGRSRFTGAFSARYSDSQTVARLLDDQRNFFEKTYKIAEASETPTTQPDAPTP
jgi:hypothetical protein